ncbi:MAG: peptidase [Deltaproteobacteria bacterium]|nr:peptidase [Deltaproteobacteria bacterium]
MTFCLGMRVKSGLVGIADTRITSGNEAITAKKVSIFEDEKSAMFLMTSGLRSARDKALIYFEELLEEQDKPFDKLYKAVNAFAAQIRRAASEDQASLEKSGLQFDTHSLIGGQMAKDHEPKLYLLYPQGNWVEVGQGTPYQIVGAGGYGKPVLDRTFAFEDSLKFALKVGLLAFDSTRISATDVDLPVDVILYEKDSFKMVEHRFYMEDLQEISSWWMEKLKENIRGLPSELIDRIINRLARPAEVPRIALRRSPQGSKNAL